MTVETRIGWDAEEALSAHIVELARAHVPAGELEHIETCHESGEWEIAVRQALHFGTPITAELAAEIRAAWLDGRDPDDWPAGRDGLRRELILAGHLAWSDGEWYARTLLAREYEHLKPQARQYVDGVVSAEEFASVIDELSVAAYERGTFTELDHALMRALGRWLPGPILQEQAFELGRQIFDRCRDRWPDVADIARLWEEDPNDAAATTIRKAIRTVGLLPEERTATLELIAGGYFGHRGRQLRDTLDPRKPLLHLAHRIHRRRRGVLPEQTRESVDSLWEQDAPVAALLTVEIAVDDDDLLPDELAALDLLEPHLRAFKNPRG